MIVLISEIAPSGGTIGAVAAAAFFLLLLGAAYVAFKALKKTVKMAFRLAVVGAILAIAFAGSIALWYFSDGGSPKLRPPAERPARR